VWSTDDAVTRPRQGDLGASNDHRNWLLAAAAYLVLAIAVTWPLALRLATHLPQGHELSGTVPLFNLWTLEWNRTSLLNGYSGYWDAPIFHPDRDALALSEPMPLPGLAYTAIRALVRSRLAAYNLLLLAALVVNGLAMAGLSRTLRLPWGASAATGAMGVTLPFVLRELSVLQLVFVFPVVFSFRQLLRFADRPNRMDALGLGFWVGATYLCCGYYFVFLVVFLTLAAAVHVRRNLLRLGAIRDLAYGGLLAAVLIAPLASHQLAALAGFDRPERQIAGNSASPVDYLELDDHALGHAFAPWLASGVGGAESLYPGTAAVVLGLFGAVLAWRASRRRWVLTCIGGSLLAGLLSLGLNLELWGLQPYRWVMEFVPGFANLRSPYRAALFVHIFLVSLAGFPLASTTRRWRRGGPALASLIVTAAILEVVIRPQPLYELPLDRLEQPWISWLASQPTGAVAMVPFASSHLPWAYEETVIGMLQGLEHGRPLVNGFSGFLPERYWNLRNFMLHFPDDRSVAGLEAAGVRYLVVDSRWLSPARRAAIIDEGSEVAYRDVDKVIFRFKDGAMDRPRGSV